MSNFKINLEVIEEFSILTIVNKYTRSTLILLSLLKNLAGNIDILSHFSCQRVENPDSNNESNKSEIKLGIKLVNGMNQDILICQTNRASNQY